MTNEELRDHQDQQQAKLIVQALIERPSKEAMAALSLGERLLHEHGYYEYEKLMAAQRKTIEDGMLQAIDILERI